MNWRNLVARAAGVGAVVSLVAMLSYEVLIPWNEAVSVPDMPLEKWMGMSDQEREKFTFDASSRIKSLSGAEKYWYIVRARPFGYLYRWLVWFVPCFVAIVTFGLMELRKRET
jgi:hypothetical protein